MNYTVGSLFAGIGGMDLGFERAGFETVWQVECNDYCRKVLAKNFPHADRSVTDVRDAGSHNLKPVDVIVGGFPCQDISHAGLRAGIEGERSGLWSEYARIIRELRPSYVLVENVAALLGRGMGKVLGDLAEIGFDAEWECLRAHDFGAPHLRDRVYLVAYPRQFDGKAGLVSNYCRTGLGRQSEEKERSNDRLIPQLGTSLTERIQTWLACERGMGRMAHGVRSRVHRVTALGNAVVPEIPYQIALRIKQALEAA
jgi:DNA (cytosine-5)-methyltransferase 1